MTINGRRIKSPLDLLIAGLIITITGPILIMSGLFLILFGIILLSPFWVPIVLLCFAI